MSVVDIIKKTYSELTDDLKFAHGIHLADDGDGIVYIEKWEYSKPIPEGLKLGK